MSPNPYHFTDRSILLHFIKISKLAESTEKVTAIINWNSIISPALNPTPNSTPNPNPTSLPHPNPILNRNPDHKPNACA